MKKLKAVVIGAGSRGTTYTDIMANYPEKFEVVGVAEINPLRRNYIKEKHNIKDEYCKATWQELLSLPKLADVALITTTDMMHFEPAMEAIRKGYNLLLEKPVAPTPEECMKIQEEAKKYGTKILVCHVLRYAPYYMKLKKAIEDGEIGEVISIQHSENVGYLHYAHAYTRGIWRNLEISAPMLLAKSCHDLDILQWLVGKECKRVSSFGSLTHFKSENAPKNAPEYCTEGCPHSDTCPYNSETIYLNTDDIYRKRTCTGKVEPTDEDVKNALDTTIWGKCIYKCDNNMVDHQVVVMEFDGGAAVDFNMTAFNEGGRFTRVMGTKGEIYRNGDNGLRIYKFADNSYTDIDIESFGNTVEDGHGGGDAGIIHSLYDYMINDSVSSQFSEIEISVKNHLIGFAAEEARLNGKVVEMDEYIKKLL